MKVALLFLSLLVLLSIIALVSTTSSLLSEQELEIAFSDWAAKHGKTYEHEAHRQYRKAVWARNLQFIHDHNKQRKSYTVAMNSFGDMSHAEFSRMYLRPIDTRDLPDLHRPLYKPRGGTPSTQDWRKQGAVTQIKNQGQCGSCWAFSTTGAIEGSWKLAGNTLISLSEQQLMDCSTSYGNMGCNGGLPFWAMQYVIDNKGLESEQNYPYEANDDNCRFDDSEVAATISSYENITSGDEDALQDAAGNTGPVSVGIDASNPSFQFYSGGVYNEPDCSTTQLDHGVLVVGYGSSSGNPYWIVKNSWGSDWGLKGYIWMTRNDNNQCGIATMAAIPSSP